MEKTLINITNDFAEEVVLEHSITWMWFLALENKNDKKILIKFNKDTNKDVNSITLKDKGNLKIPTIELLNFRQINWDNMWELVQEGKKWKEII